MPLSIRADTGLRLCAARYARVTQAGKEPPTGNVEPEIEFHWGSVWHAAELSAPILGFDVYLAVVGAGIVAGAALVAVTASPAGAASTCTTWKSSNGGTAYGKCTGGNTRFSLHRVWAVCIGPDGKKFNVEGNRVSTRQGKTSKAVCSSNPRQTSIGVYSMKIETEEPV
ncbi:hypothetical protein SALBM311S_00452 [Streptomyces alboniger]